ncbi:MAG: HEAT repeat domain-containing protein, partial [Methanobacterium paludis]|nr:HEAT repeat domain-containing protein [Methanobacterium paludis]
AKAATKLGNLGCTNSINALIKALNDPSTFVPSKAASSLGKIKDKKAIKPLINQFKSENVIFRESALKALVKIGKNAVPELVASLNHKDVHTRQMSVEALGELNTIEHLNEIIKALNDEESTVRWRAARALGKLGDFKGVKPLQNALKDSDEKVKSEAKAALVKIGPNLKKALSDESSGVRWNAARAVSKWYDEDSVNTLKELSQKDPDHKVREEATKSLKTIESVVKNLFNDFEKHLEYISTDIKSRNIKGGKSFSSPEKKFFSAHFFNPYKIRFYIYQGAKGIKELNTTKGDPHWGAIYLQKEEDVGKVLEVVKKSYIITKKEFK